MTPNEAFPKDFIWGTAISAHQVEGGGRNDWTVWESTRKGKDPSGHAADFYHRYDQDFQLASQVLHNNSIRLSLEWARIVPEEGRIDQKEIEHYRNVLLDAREQNLSPMVTLHHFTNPVWFADKGGWTKKENIEHFLNYISICKEHFGELADYFVTINEPNVYASQSYLWGSWPPQRKNPILAYKVYQNLVEAHRGAYSLLVKDKPIGFSINMQDYRGFPPLAKLTGRLLNDSFLDLTRGTYTFIGINYYKPKYVTPVFRRKALRRSEFGWEIDSAGLYNVVMRAWSRYHLPIFITENGVSDSTDTLRPEFVSDHLACLLEAIKCGADVRGYYYWSLYDNFEWAEGYKQKFGLFEIDFSDPVLKRIQRESAELYGRIAKTGRLPLAKDKLSSRHDLK